MKTVLLILAVVTLAYAEDPVIVVNATKGAGDAPPCDQGDVKLRTSLSKSLMTDYDRGINPDGPNVTMAVSLITLKVNEKDSTLDTNLWLRYSWYDSRLAWNTSIYPVDVLRVCSRSIWRPDVMLFNAAEIVDISTSCVETYALIYPTGNVILVPPCKFKSLCSGMTLKSHAYEAQECTLKFGPWSYGAGTMDFDFDKNETTIDLTYFEGLPGWKVSSTCGEKNIKIYNSGPEPYADLTYSLTIQRQPGASVCAN